MDIGDDSQSPLGEIREGTHIVIPQGGRSMAVFHDGSLDPRVPGTEVVDSFKVTEVDWDPETGEWVSRLKDGREICRASTKRRVVSLEHEILAEMEAEGKEMPKGPSGSNNSTNE